MQDIDDALHTRPLPNGNIEVGVHIADVTAFVSAGTPIDEEAAKRGTSVYLVERRIDMLPKALTEDICSLRRACAHLNLICMAQPRNGLAFWFARRILSVARLSAGGAWLAVHRSGVERMTFSCLWVSAARCCCGRLALPAAASPGAG